MSLTMKPGDLAKTTSINALFEDLRLTFKAKKGSRMVFLFLGVEVDGENFDPIACMKAFGWTPTRELQAELDNSKTDALR